MRLAILIASVSAAVLGYEIALMRGLSVARWHHFAYMIVSIALLGFGASGTLLSLWGRRLLKHRDVSLVGFAAAFAASIPASFALSQRVPFDVFQLAWDWRQYAYLGQYYLILFVPFLLGATVIGLALTGEAQRAHRIYFWNLLGSGLGACGVVALMFVLWPRHLPHAAATVAWVGMVVYALPGRGRRTGSLAAGVGTTTLLALLFTRCELNISEHKQLRLLLDQPDTRMMDQRTSPLGLVHVVDSPLIHLVAGRSAAYLGEEPRQRALILDADSASAINQLTDPSQAAAFDYTTSALPYHLLARPRTLIIGAGGGSDVVLACSHGCPSITALELDFQVADLMRGSQAEFSQHLYEQAGVELVVAEARGFLARTDEKYDLIQLPLVDSFSAASGGVTALNESYLYTLEAFESYLNHLTDRGLLAITRWLRTPPSDVPRILGTLAEALESHSDRHADPSLSARLALEAGSRVIAIRGMFTATILASRRGFSPEQLDATRAFCRQRSFDLVWLGGVPLWEEAPDGTVRAVAGVNQYNELAEPYYADGATTLFVGDRGKFIRSYPFDITPTTDDRPYHSLTFRWRALRDLRETMGDQWVRYADWGYLVLVATLVQAIVAGLVLIILPLFFLRRREGQRGGRLATCIYFACLGMAYMLVEIVLMQKLSLFLASPIYSAAVVLASFMVFSGLGSLTAGRILDRERRAAGLGILGILVIGLTLWFGLDGLLRHLAGSPTWLRFLVASASGGLLAFWMGMPFPSGLRRAASRVPALTPWAWGVNGCASVVGATLAMVLAVSYGFRVVLLLAFALYALAALALGGVRSAAGGSSP